MPSKNDYKPTLIALMSFLDGVTYQYEQEFTNQRLLQITPDDVKRWMNLKAYGTPEPGDDDLPKQARSSSLEYWKKAISSYMPNRLMPWNVQSNQGNPTRSTDVNELIKKVKKEETRNRGAPSKKRRPLKDEEYRAQIKILEENQTNSMLRKYLMPSLFRFQVHMIGRIDDCTQFLNENFTPHPANDFTLRARLNWSKNCLEERDAPNQILIGAMDPQFCSLLGLAIWLEVFHGAGGAAERTPYIFGLTDDLRVPEGGEKVKDAVTKILANEVYIHPEFVAATGSTKGLVGSHSNRKYGSTRARKNGCQKDEKDYRGRWKISKRISDLYDDVELPWPDVKVASALCVGGPCKYIVKEGAGVSNDFLLEHVVPAINNKFGSEIALVLGKALLWFAFSEESEYLPQHLRERILQAYNGVRQLPIGENPIKKVLMVVTGEDAEVYFNEVVDVDDGGNGAQNGGVAAGRGLADRNLLLAMHSEVRSLRRIVEELKASSDDRHAQLERRLANVERNMRRLASQPAFRVVRNQEGNQQAAGNVPPQQGANNNNNPNHVPYESTLSPNPRTVHILWQEYENGIGGRKAARDFTREERGRVKHKCHRRKVLWDVVAGLVRAGLSAQVACDRVYQVYGAAKPVTQIINALKHDKRNNRLSPLLQV